MMSRRDVVQVIAAAIICGVLIAVFAVFKGGV